jgi:hypothetical protein
MLAVGDFSSRLKSLLYHKVASRFQHHPRAVKERQLPQVANRDQGPGTEILVEFCQERRMPKKISRWLRHWLFIATSVYIHVELDDQTAAIAALPGPPNGNRLKIAGTEAKSVA